MKTEESLISVIPILSDKPFLEKGDKLVCFGDSLTQRKTGYFSYLKPVLEAKGIEVINAGIGGEKTPNALMRLQRDVLAHKPTAVSIFFGTNDAIHGHGRWSHEPAVSWQALRDNLKWIVHICRQNGIKKISICSLPGELEGAALAEYGIRQDHIKATRLAAEESGALLVPLDYVFREGAKLRKNERTVNGLLYTCDGVHSTPESAEVIAKTMLHAWNLK